MKAKFGIIILAVAISGCSVKPNETPQTAQSACGDYNPNLNLYWGDVHVHTAYSMDAYAFGTKALPSDAFAFARGQKVQTMPDGTPVTQSRPLDFAAVTDHAETFGVMHTCTDPEHNNQSEYCQQLRSLSGTDQANSLNVFRNFLLPVISGEKPKPAVLCAEAGLNCEAAAMERWAQVQSAANAADSPCEFSAFIGYEWSATPGSSHWHRNIIFKTAAVTKTLVDYVTYPTTDQMWQALETQCKPEDGCDVLAIPHNTNLSEGGGFDVEHADQKVLERRARFERIMELTQSKGTSECLNENWDDYDSDCGFETYLLPGTQKALSEDASQREDFNRSFARNILGRGLESYKASGGELNPLQLGFIGSTDGHTATPGLVEESEWKGDAWAGGDSFKTRWLARLDYSPGGLVGVWASQNTRADIFEALKARRAFATSGPRMGLRFAMSPALTAPESCEEALKAGAPMGSTVKAVNGEPNFAIETRQDKVPLWRTQVIKGTIKSGKLSEQVITLREDAEGYNGGCNVWSDPDFDPSEPAYWYVRAEQMPTPRWSKLVCEDMGNCADYPGADRMIKERAWSSPIWYLPEIKN